MSNSISGPSFGVQGTQLPLAPPTAPPVPTAPPPFTVTPVGDEAAAVVAGSKDWSPLKVFSTATQGVSYLGEAPVAGAQSGATWGGGETSSTIDNTQLPRSAASVLTGMSVGTTSDGQQVTLRRPLGVEGSVHDARIAATADGRPQVVVALKNGAARFAIPSGIPTFATPFQPGTMDIVHGPKLFSIDETGAPRFVRRMTSFKTNEPIGTTIATPAGEGTVRTYLGSFQNEARARARIKGSLESTSMHVVLQANGPKGKFHAYSVAPPVEGTPAWDPQMGGLAATAWNDRDVRTVSNETVEVPTQWGPDVVQIRNTFQHAARLMQDASGRRETAATEPQRIESVEVSRVLAFNPNSAVGSNISLGNTRGHLTRYLQSFSSQSAAESYARSASGASAGTVVLEKRNSVGTFHVYQYAQGSSSGPSWPTSTAKPVFGTWDTTTRSQRTVREPRAGEWGTDYYTFRITDERTDHIQWKPSSGTSVASSDRPHEIDRELIDIDHADRPTSPGDTNGGRPTSPGDTNGGRPTSPGDSNGSRPTSPGDSSGSRPTSSGDSRPSGSSSAGTRPSSDSSSGDSRPTTPSSGSTSGSSSSNGNPSDSDF